jgi:hypothetical protein
MKLPSINISIQKSVSSAASTTMHSLKIFPVQILIGKLLYNLQQPMWLNESIAF